MSKTYATSGRLFPYFLSFRDLHNFWLPPEEYAKIFNPKYLAMRLNTEVTDTNNFFLEKMPVARFMSTENRLKLIEKAGNHDRRNYPQTRDENIKILDNYLRLCEENQVCPIMFLAPSTEGYMKLFNKRKIDEFRYIVNEATKKYPTAYFLDGWRLPPFPDEDFYESSHLNRNGAKKFSTILNNVIEQLERK